MDLNLISTKVRYFSLNLQVKLLILKANCKIRFHQLSKNELVRKLVELSKPR